MSNNLNRRGVVVLLLVLMSIIPTITMVNRTIPSWKRSNSIEMLKKLIANRQILTKYNRTFFSTSKLPLSHRTSFKNLYTTFTSTPTIDTKQPSHTLAILFIITSLFLIVILTIFTR